MTLAFAPRNTPHHAAFARAGALSLAATLLVVAAALIIRFSGDSISRLAHRALHPISARLATAAAARVLDLRAGFRTISTLSEFLAALALSLLLWTGIAASYLLSATAFRASPHLATFTLSATMLLLASGLGGSLLQLPVLGWFTQIAVLAAALHGFFAAPLETAIAAQRRPQRAADALEAGLDHVVRVLAAHLQGIGLRDALVESSQQ